MIPDQSVLFAANGPDGFAYSADFLTAAEEASLLADIQAVAFSSFEMRGVVAKRRVAFFGHSYGRAIEPEIPEFLESLRSRLAVWAGVQPEAFAMALINEYQPGSPIGWHRDAPQYDIVAGVSLVSACRMKFRPYTIPADAGPTAARRRAAHELVLEPRSAYLLTGPARSDFEHHIPPVPSLRYSVTFRTLRARRGKDRAG